MSKKEPLRPAQTDGDAIAIIGMGCRFPGGVKGPDDYWELLRSGKDAIVEVPPERWNKADFYHPDRDKPGKMVTKYGGFIDGIDRFDPEFFGISPHEAHHMDPQQRHLLEVTWEALEDGGLQPHKLRGHGVGVFVGAFALDYHALQFGDPFQRDAGPYTAASSMTTMISNRISYIFDFQGPSMTVDTACSSSLVSLHLACESLRNGESQVAVAGGVVLIFTPQYTLVESRGGFLSPDGRCKTFDASANGYVRGEGVGMVVLKRLADAVADGDHIQGVIMASGVNQDGHTVGITVPSSDAQERLIRETLRKSGLPASAVQYVEAHGTGTPVGDPIEARAIAAAYSGERPGDGRLIVGSCKTNIGHTESAAGIAGLIKAVLCLKHKQIPPNLHFDEPNPAIPFEDWKIRVPLELQPWPQHQGAAAAAVNSFGYGGTNAHVIVREAIGSEMHAGRSQQSGTEERRQDRAAASSSAATADGSALSTGGIPAPRSYLLPLSARKADGLSTLSAAYKALLSRGAAAGADSDHLLADLCWSAGARREHHRYRQAFVVHDKAELNGLLDLSIAGQSGKGIAAGKKASGEIPRLVWTFSGMGPQWYGMGRQLLSQEPVFYETLARCDRLFFELAGWSMLAELGKDEADSLMDETEISMPISFALQVALAALWRSWGIVPDAIVGHSAGEVAAFYEAGVYTLEDALCVVYHRSRLLQRLSGRGGMAAVGVTEAVAESMLEQVKDKVDIAAINSPSSVTLAGDSEALEHVLRLAGEQSYFCRKLKVQAPFHSHYMEEIKDELLASLHNVPARANSIPLYSTVTAELVDGAAVDAFYWWRNVRETVRFAPAIEQLLGLGYTAFLEIGAHPVLSGALTECFKERSALAVASIRRKEDEHHAMMNSLAQLYIWGLEPNWDVLYPQGQWIKLPPYPWHSGTYWHEPDMIRLIRLGHRDHPLLGRPLLGAMAAWEGEVSLLRFPYLQDHRVLDGIVFPAAGYIEAIMGALQHTLGQGSYVLEHIELHRSMTLSQPSAVLLTQHYLDVENGTFQIYGAADAPNSPFTLHASGRVRQLQKSGLSSAVDLKREVLATPHPIDRDKAYRILNNMGFDYGPYFQGIRAVHLGIDEAWVEVEMDIRDNEAEGYEFHPRLMDACFQALLAAEFPLEGETPKETRLEFRIPVRIGEVRYYRKPEGRLWAHSKVSERNSMITKGDLHIYDEQGRLVARFLDFVKQAVDAAVGKINSTQLKRWFYELQWQPDSKLLPPAKRMTRKDVWLFLGDEGDFAAAAASQLHKQDFDTVIVKASADGSYSFTPASGIVGNRMDPANREHYDLLVKDALQAYGSRLRGIVHCWNLDLPSAEGMAEREGIEPWSHVKALSGHSLLYAAQSIAGSHASARIWVVTCGSQATQKRQDETLQHPLSVFQAAAWGLGRTLSQQELRDYWGGMVDLDPAATTAESAELFIQELVSEEAGAEDQIAYRGGQRYLLRMNHAADIPGLSLPMRCRGDGAYLITGAFGAIGQETARLLVKRGARRLLLVGRSRLPERSQWKDAASGSSDAERIAYVLELEAAGVHVEIISLDITNIAALSDYMKAYVGSGQPPICGVVHSAGAVRDILIEHMSQEAFDEAFEPKVKGAWNLHLAMDGQPLEFFILFSSLAAILPPAGQGNYAAGNAFMDALAAYRLGQGLPALSINWGPWTVGMVDKLNLTAHFQENGIDCIRAGEGMRLLEHLIGQNNAQVAVLSAEWRAVRRLYPGVALLNLLDKQAGQAGDGTTEEATMADLLKTLDASLRGPLILEKFTALVAELLHFDHASLDTTKTLPEIGLDSMMAIKLRIRIQNEFGTAPMVGDLLSGIPITALADKLAEQYEQGLKPELQPV
ncbi:type I polyketide synthase [Paenibacillus oenotherae]|uniref:Type I polyketide synthase n=1 Tax=Paenibacillus oenotherae TaxID=1435645 RepID=A0ABS7D2G9_9BACL|nr:type I polyketide synthase [Paenibacillus oenotherae]MBW7474090.1 type I polyketide synthase [Paenibacillus oenotherae]